MGLPSAAGSVKVVNALLDLSDYSTERQSESSIDDQFRVCERVSERHGFSVSARFSDEALSGGTARRPGYQSLLAAARRREFRVIVAEDLKRLWREQAEQWRAIKELIDLDIAIITASGIDSRQPNFEVIASVYGASAELDRKETGYRTRRGLEGKARAGKSAGGRAYGYNPPALSGTGEMEIDRKQANVVRRIYMMFADGYSPRAIADALNRERVASPGSSWARALRRKKGWVYTAVNSILGNSLYCGEVVWNRCKWVRSAADSSRRRRVLNPRTEWIVRQDERLRIVDQRLWRRVTERRAAQARRVGEIGRAHV